MKLITIFLFTFYILITNKSASQEITTALDNPTSLQELFDNIKIREPLLSFPNLDDTLTVGVIDLAALGAADIGFSFAVPTYTSGSYAYPDPNAWEETRSASPHAPQIRSLFAPNRGGDIKLANELHVNLRFKIINWSNSHNAKLIIILGGTVQKLDYGTGEAIFLDVKDEQPDLIIRAEGYDIDPVLLKTFPQVYKGKNSQVGGLIAFKIERKILAAGAITIPVIPVSIIYAPVVDAQKLNTASSLNTETLGNITTISFAKEHSISLPFETNFEDTKGTQDWLDEIAKVLSNIPLPVTQIISKAASGISKDLGSAIASQTTANMNSQQFSTSVALTKSIAITAYAKEGGPGVGDVFVFYRNAKVFWRSENKKLYLTLLGADPIQQVSAAELERGLNRLRKKAKISVDDSLKLDANSISQLLKLDPFTNTKGGADLADGRRFKKLDPWQIKAGSNIQTLKYSLKSDDLTATSSITTNVETDKEGALSKYGLGVTDDQTIQTKISQTNSKLKSTTQEFSEQCNLFGNSPGNDYSVQIYVDVVFGSFAFQLLKN